MKPTVVLDPAKMPRMAVHGNVAHEKVPRPQLQMMQLRLAQAFAFQPTFEPCMLPGHQKLRCSLVSFGNGLGLQVFKVHLGPPALRANAKLLADQADKMEACQVCGALGEQPHKGDKHALAAKCEKEGRPLNCEHGSPCCEPCFERHQKVDRLLKELNSLMDGPKVLGPDGKPLQGVTAVAPGLNVVAGPEVDAGASDIPEEVPDAVEAEEVTSPGEASPPVAGEQAQD